MVTVGLSTEIYRRLHFGSGYWIPMTALLVLRPGLVETVSRTIARIVGTVAGAWLLSLLVSHFALPTMALAALTVLFAWFSYAVQNVNYAMYAVSITGYIVFLLSLAEVASTEIAQRRALCTAVGGVLALAVRLTVIQWRKKAQVSVAQAAIRS